MNTPTATQHAAAQHADAQQTNVQHETVQREAGQPRSGGLLGNMSARPRTPIRREIPSIGVPTLGSRWLLLKPRRTGRPVSLRPKDITRLDAAWEKLGLTGAVLLHPATVAGQPDVQATLCADPDLTLNVLLRARGRLLLAGAPLIVDTYGQPLGAYTCDDPRLLLAAGIAGEPAGGGSR